MLSAIKAFAVIAGRIVLYTPLLYAMMISVIVLVDGKSTYPPFVEASAGTALLLLRAVGYTLTDLVTDTRTLAAPAIVVVAMWTIAAFYSALSRLFKR